MYLVIFMLSLSKNNELFSFENESQILKYLIKLEEYNNIKSDSIDINDLINFIIFYKKEKKLFSSNINKINDSFKNQDDNPIINDFINEFIRMNSDGKYIRAALIALGYLLNKDQDDNSYLELALAYETFQTAILVHDDIIDNSDTRRGKKTIPFIYKELFSKYNTKKQNYEKKKNHIADSIGICAGDIGFFLTNKLIINKYHNIPSFKDLLNLYNDIVIKTIKGEVIDVLLPFKSEFDNTFKVKENDVMEIYKLKTSWYTIVGPFLLGMTLSGSNKNNIEIIKDALMPLGIAFQIKDDILGIYGNSKELGKSNTSDISEFKQTILYTYVSEKNNSYMDKLLNIYGKENINENELHEIQNIFETSGALEYATNTMNKMFEESYNKIKNIDFINDNYKSIIRGLITYLKFRNY